MPLTVLFCSLSTSNPTSFSNSCSLQLFLKQNSFLEKSNLESPLALLFPILIGALQRPCGCSYFSPLWSACLCTGALRICSMHLLQKWPFSLLQTPKHHVVMFLHAGSVRGNVDWLMSAPHSMEIKHVGIGTQPQLLWRQRQESYNLGASTENLMIFFGQNK